MTDAYHSDFQTVSKTMLAHFHRSPRQYQRYFVTREATPPVPKSVLVGSIAHDVLLTDATLSQTAMVYPDDCLMSNGAINWRPARDFEASLMPSQYACKQQVFDQVDKLLKHLARHPVISLIEQATGRESPIYWTDEVSGLDCRCRPDFWHADVEGISVVYDLKFTSQIYPSEFWLTARRFRYWMQDAHYSRGVRAETGQHVKFVFWAVEDTPPHRVARYEYTPDSRENAHAEVSRCLLSLAECYRKDQWEDAWTSGVNDLLFTHSESTTLELDWGGEE